MRRILSIGLNTYRETVRDRVLYTIGVFALVMIGSAYALGRLSVGQEVRIIKDLGLAAIEVLGAAVAILVGMRLISKETERRTLYSVLAKPVTRAQFVLGKYCGLCLTLAVNLVAMAGSLYAVLLLGGGGLDRSLLSAMYLTYWELALLSALALLFGTFTSATLSAVFTAGLYVVGHFSADLKHFDAIVKSGPLPVVTRVLYYALPNLENFDVKDQILHGDPVSWAVLGLATLYGALYVSAVLLLAVLFFERRDLA